MRASSAPKQITECAGHGGGFAGHRGALVRGTHIIEYVMRCCNVGSIVLVLVSLYVRTLDGREHWCIEFPRWSPIYSLFSDFGSKIPEETIPCQIGCLVSCVRACLCFASAGTTESHTMEEEEAQTELYDAKLRAFSYGRAGLIVV